MERFSNSARPFGIPRWRHTQADIPFEFIDGSNAYDNTEGYAHAGAGRSDARFLCRLRGGGSLRSDGAKAPSRHGSVAGTPGLRGGRAAALGVAPQDPIFGLGGYHRRPETVSGAAQPLDSRNG